MPRDAAQERFVYFVQAVLGGPIKIGVTNDPNGRLRTLQCGSPVELRFLMVVSGNLEMETQLHRDLAAHRLHGEWFADHADVWQAISEALRNELLSIAGGALRSERTLIVDRLQQAITALESDSSDVPSLKAIALSFGLSSNGSDHERQLQAELTSRLER